MTTKTTLVACRVDSGALRCASAARFAAGAVRAVAFVGSASGAAADDDFVHAPDARLVIAAGEGRPAPAGIDEAAWASPGRDSRSARTRAQWWRRRRIHETRWLLFTASAKGEALLWDLRESRSRASSLTTGANQKPSLRCDVAGACGSGAAVTAATVRGGRLAFGFANGGSPRRTLGADATP